MTKMQAAWYLAGIIDGEGCVYSNPKNGYREVAIYNTSDLILDAAEEALKLLGISYYKAEYLSTKGCKELRLTGQDNLQRLHDLVPLQSEKKEKLRVLLTTYKRQKRGR